MFERSTREAAIRPGERVVVVVVDRDSLSIPAHRGGRADSELRRLETEKSAGYCGNADDKYNMSRSKFRAEYFADGHRNVNGTRSSSNDSDLKRSLGSFTGKSATVSTGGSLFPPRKEGLSRASRDLSTTRARLGESAPGRRRRCAFRATRCD